MRIHFEERDEQAKATAHRRNCRDGACRSGTRKPTAWAMPWEPTLQRLRRIAIMRRFRFRLAPQRAPGHLGHLRTTNFNREFPGGTRAHSGADLRAHAL